MSKFPTEKAVLVLDDLDKPIKGAEAIRAARGCIETLQQTFYALENGHIPARKRGRFWETTLRRLMSDATTPATTPAPIEHAATAESAAG
jgi:hypothetical protein